MSWIKRNLSFVIGGLVAVGLLGSGGYYIYQSWSQNGAARDSLNETYNDLDQLTRKTPSPGNDQINNIDIAVAQRKQLTDWMTSVTGLFQPIPPIPQGMTVADSATFRTALAVTIKQMQEAAAAANVSLPPNYGFSFEAYRNQLNLPVASLPDLSVQLGEVKAITDILLNARVNALDGIQRLRISDTDTAGPGTDYLDDQATTNNLGVLTPYAVSFRSFTPEIAQVLAGFAACSNAIIVKSISVQPAGGTDANGMATGPDGNPVNPMNPMGNPPGMMPGMAPGMPPGYGMERPPVAAPPSTHGGLPTVLKEQMLSVKLQLAVVKLLPQK